MSVNHYPVPLSAADTISSAGPRVGPERHPLPKEAVTNLFSRSCPTKCLMFCSRNKGADAQVRRLIFACNKVGVHTSTDVW